MVWSHEESARENNSCEDYGGVKKAEGILKEMVKRMWRGVRWWKNKNCGQIR